MPPRIGPDWRRLSRWFLFGTIVMVLWLLAPTARCSFHAFRDTPLGEMDPANDNPANADRRRIDEGRGFFGEWLGHVKTCYEATPLLDQEAWKTSLLGVLAGATVLAWVLGRLEAKRNFS